MNDSIWAKEHTTAAALDGLTAEETQRFDEEASSELKQATKGLRTLDASLRNLFQPLAPATVEVASVNRLRHEWTRQTMERGWQRTLTYGLAASVGLGLVGAGVMALGGLPMPGQLAVGAKPEAKPTASFMAKRGEIQTDFEKESVLTEQLHWDEKAIDKSESMDVGRAVGGGRPANPAPKVPIPTPSQMYGENRSRIDDLPHNGRVGGAMEGQLEAYKSLESALTDKKLSGEEKLSDWSSQEAKSAQSDAMNRFQYMATVPPAFATGKDDSGGNSSASDRSRMLGRSVTAPKTSDIPADKELSLKTAKDQQFDDNLKGYFANPTSGNVPALRTGRSASGTPAQAATRSADPPVARKIIIRSGEIEFEVESFDASVAGVTSLVLKIDGAFVATVNSEKMANGKVKGSVVVRIPPESLDQFVLDLRKELSKTGELKGQRIGSQDITKQYTDLESRLKAARTMETRLLEMIKNGKGEIKQLLDAEKELGVWRTKIEEYEGELRFYSNQASLSTLTITITEKEIRTAASLTESEKISAGLEVEEVDKAYRALQAAIADLKGRTIKAEMKTHTFGQSATLAFEVSHESTGPMQDRLKQIGTVARMNSDRVQSSDGQPVPRETKVKRGDTLFEVQIYNLTSVRPRETATVQLAVPNVGESFLKLRETITKSSGRLLNANLNEQDKRNVTAQIDFEVKRTEEAQIRAAFDAAGETVSRNVVRAPEAEVMTDAKVLYRVTLSSTERITPREKLVLASEVSEVNPVVAVLNSYVREINGVIVDESSIQDRGKVTTRVIYQVPLAAASGLAEKVKAAGILRVSNSSRDANAPDGKFALARVEVTLSNEERIVAPEDGVWPQVRKGLSYSATVLLTSVTWVVFGLCVVLPWALVGYGGYRLLKALGLISPSAGKTPTN
ncbi:MAG: DUF4349 domain-containing protein [Gemmataceae bacterium]